MEFPVAGFTAPGFEAVQEAFVDNFDHGVDVGAGFCAVVEGEVVVDLVGGYRDAAMTRPWQPDTLVNVYSTTKGLAAVAVACLVEAGELDYEAPVRRWWPELRAAAAGLTVTQLLSHQAGLCGLTEPITVEDLYDWDGMCRRLERQEPLWPPGTAAGYHAVTWGFLVGELVRRATGVSLGTVLRDRVAEPLGADVHLGLADEQHHRVADLIGPNRARRGESPVGAISRSRSEVRSYGDTELRPGERSHKGLESRPGGRSYRKVAMENPVIRPFGDACSAPWRRAELAASNGHATARGIATIYGALVDTIPSLLTPLTVDALHEEVWGREEDLVLGYPMRRGRGVNLNTAGELGPSSEAFGHTGTGGSMGFADPRRRVGAAYVMNQLWDGSGPETRSGRLITALYQCLARSSP